MILYHKIFLNECSITNFEVAETDILEQTEGIDIHMGVTNV